MSIQFYSIPVASGDHVRDCLYRHLTKTRESWEFASDDIKEPITFATVLTLNTLAPVIGALSRSDLTKVNTLDSGWSYRRIDLGAPKNTDLVFTAPGSNQEGFILRVAPSPFVSDEVGAISAYLFTDRKFWMPSSRKTVLTALRDRTTRIPAFEHSPQYAGNLMGRPFLAEGPSRPYDPESVLAILPPLIEALTSFDPVLFFKSVTDHTTTDYKTLFEENQDILTATRSTMVQDNYLAGPALARFVNFLWQTGMAKDLESRLADIDGLATMLTDQGNTSKRTEYDFDDDKYGAYVKTDEGMTTVFFRHEKDAMAISRSDDTLVISAADYKTSETFEAYVNLSLEEGGIARANEAAPLRSHVTSLIRRWVVQIEGIGEMLEDDHTPEPDAPRP